MSHEQNKELVRRVIDEVWHTGNMSAIDQLFTTSFVNHDPDAADARDRAGYKGWAEGLRRAMPDLRVTIDGLIAEGDLVSKRWTARATNTGPLPGMEATGKRVTFGGVTIYRMEQGRVAECWWHKDMLGLLQQLGAIRTF